MISKLLKNKYLQLILQSCTLLIFIALVLGALQITTNDKEFALILRNTNLSNLIVWSYWWPLIIITSIFMGRIWCTICPMQLISSIFTKWGLQCKVPKWIQSGWVTVLLYTFIACIAIHFWGIHRIPQLMAIYLVSLMLLTIIISLIFKGKAFCNYFCPVGKVLGLYALIAPCGLRAKEKICKTCRSKNCVNRHKQSKIIGGSCNAGLYPANIAHNKDCILCGQCIKVCPNNSIKFQYIKKGYSSFSSTQISTAEIGMISILLGFVTSEVMTSFAHTKILWKWLPKQLVDFSILNTFPVQIIESVVLFLLIPLLLLLGIAYLVKLSSKLNFKSCMQKTVIFLLPIIAMGHLLKALIKSASRLPYWPLALSKPDGVENAKLIASEALHLNKIPIISIVMLILGCLGLIIGIIMSSRKIISDQTLNRISISLYLILVWFFFILFIIGPLFG